MHLSLWLDEAWVANAILAPSLKEMIYYPHFVQSTPVLFLLLERFGAVLLGASEIALRVLPWIGSLAAAFLFCDVLRRLFPLPLAIIFTALFTSNYWAIKYGQQLKQYGTDLFVSAMLVWLISLLLTSQPNPRLLRSTIILCVACCFLSLPAVFWLPGLAVAVGLAGVKTKILPTVLVQTELLRVAVPVFALFAFVVGINYILFIAPNHPDIIANDWDTAYHAYLGSGSLLTTVPDFFRTLSNLLIPRLSSLGALPWLGLSLLLAFGVLRSIRNALSAKKTAWVTILAGVLPIGLATVASWMRKYPLLDYPRLVLWMLPAVLLILAYALEPAIAFCVRKLRAQRAVLLPAIAFAGSVLFVLGTSALLARQPVSSEDNRDLFAAIAKSWRPGDAIFLHGGVAEQFEYYRHRMHWNPSPVYLGNTDWPCCALGQNQRSSTPTANTLKDDVVDAIRTLRPSTLWVVLPSGSSDAWSGQLAPKLKTIPETLSSSGCPVSQIRDFGQVMLEVAACNKTRPRT